MFKKRKFRLASQIPQYGIWEYMGITIRIKSRTRFDYNVMEALVLHSGKQKYYYDGETIFIHLDDITPITQEYKIKELKKKELLLNV